MNAESCSVLILMSSLPWTNWKRTEFDPARLIRTSLPIMLTQSYLRQCIKLTGLIAACNLLMEVSKDQLLHILFNETV